ncbi:uncharacterized protein [Polyergus mexicanus]|uniref:uncharacterized protein n=1 Tax=Polyergus mexicanus TaxID=615972 RepID=UPI0038B68100
MQLVSCSTPINKETLHVPYIQLSNIFDSTTTNHIDNDHIVQQISGFTHNNKSQNNSDIQLSTLNNIQHYTTNVNQSTKIVILEKTATKNSIVQNDTSESSIPSGATEILNAIGDDWLISSTENKDDNNCDNVKNNIRDNYDDQENNNKCDNSNELAKTSDYSLNDNTNSSNKNNTDNTHRTSQSHSMQSNSSMELNSVQIHDVSPLDIRKVQVPYSKDSSLKRTIKKYFCPYCKKLQTKFARHLEIKHKTEADVQKFIHIKKGIHERAKVIAAIRNHGNYLHNTYNKLNTSTLITVRQCQAKYKKSADNYICCTNCKGFYSKDTIRIHYSKCKTIHKKGVREITVMGRRLTGYIHTSATKTLREIVFPVLRDDTVTKCIKYDELLILFGNKLCERYTNTHQHDMIRAHLRLLGRYKLAIQEINKEINDFQLIFQPQNFNSAVSALRIGAKWDRSIMWFKTPAVANTLTTLLKKCASTLKAECIKKQDYKRKQAVDDFLVLWHEEVPTVINRKAVEDQIKYKRQKKVIIPSKQDIKLLYDYLRKQCETSLYTLEKEFDLSSWKILTECTLILVQIFNRRRAGEIERLTMTDYKNQEILDKNVNPDLYEKLSKESQQYAKRFTRITIRGKLGRTVPVLLEAICSKCK